jgi:hypothetical protein
MKRGYLYVLGAIVLFSTIEVVSKYIQSGQGAASAVGPQQVATLRFLFGAAFILVLLLGRHQGKFVARAVRADGLPVFLLGAVGGTYSTPIIRAPEAAILLLGRSRWLPVVRQGQIVPRLMLPLSLSYDHRLVDGAAAARFLNEVIDLLQSPGRLLLAG